MSACTLPSVFPVLLSIVLLGPLVCHFSGPISLLDIQTFRPLAIRGEVLSSGTFGNHGYDLTISGDGQTRLPNCTRSKADQARQ